MKTLQKVGMGVDKTTEKRLGNGDCQPCIEDKVGVQTKKAQDTFVSDMNAIAYGVETWFEENTGYSRSVIESTLGVARKLGVPENEIERWAASRLICDMERAKGIKSLIERRRGNSEPC